MYKKYGVFLHTQWTIIGEKPVPILSIKFSELIIWEDSSALQTY